MSVGQSKGIRARQGKMVRMVGKAERLVDELKLIPRDPYVVSDFINVPTTPPKVNIVSRAVKAMMAKFKPEPEIDVVNCTYTQTIQLSEPDTDAEQIRAEDIARMVKMMEDQFMRDMLGPYAASEFEKSLRAAKVELPRKYGKSAVIGDLTNLT